MPSAQHFFVYSSVMALLRKFHANGIFIHQLYVHYTLLLFSCAQRVDGEEERMGREANWVKLPSASSILSDSRPNLMYIELTFLFSHFLLRN